MGHTCALTHQTFFWRAGVGWETIQKINDPVGPTPTSTLTCMLGHTSGCIITFQNLAVIYVAIHNS
jgi:hypothetical protein